MRFTCTGCGLSDALWAKYAAIYGTFVIEASAIIFLAIPRLHCGRRPCGQANLVIYVSR